MLQLKESKKYAYQALVYGLLFTLLPCVVNGESKLINIAYLEQLQPLPAALSNLDPPLSDEARQGARLAIIDNNTTGQFTGHNFQLKEVLVPVAGSLDKALVKLAEEGFSYVVVNSKAGSLTRLADIAEQKNLLLFNIAAQDGSLRNELCSEAVMHITPSYAMRADALAQFMLKKRWQKALLVKGTAEQDKLFAQAIRRSSKRYGISLVEEKSWPFEHDARRTAQAEIPVFTQSTEYDMLLVADVAGLFGEYLPFNSWLPRPVAGTQGLVATAWHKTHERWGAAQLQRRFYKQANRVMSAKDYSAWLAVRALGEAVTRSKTTEVKALQRFMLSDDFSLAGFQGIKLSFRRWNQQLRQPVLLSAERSLVAVMPLREILHPRTYLDTLGYDEKESTCGLQ